MENSDANSYRVTPFWLRPKKEYIIENFTEVVRYLRNYEFGAAPNHPDYDSTLECMSQLASERVDAILNQPFCSETPLDFDLLETLRMMSAALLGYCRQGVTPTELLLDIVIVIARLMPEKYNGQLIDLVPNIIRKSQLDINNHKFSLNFENIYAGQELLIVHLLNSLKFKETNTNEKYCYENYGRLVLGAGSNELMLIGCTEKQQRLKKIYKLFTLNNAFTIATVTAGIAKPNNISRSIKLFKEVAKELHKTANAIQPVLKTFVPGDEVEVRVTNAIGTMIVAETISPDYQKVKGKVRYRDLYLTNLPAFKPSAIKEGDCFTCRLINNPEFKFDLVPALQDFYYDSLERGQRVNAIYASTNGSRDMWVTEIGTRIYFDPNYQPKGQPIDREGLEIYNNALREGHGVVFQLHDDYELDKPFFARAVVDSFDMDEAEDMTIDAIDSGFSEEFMATISIEDPAATEDHWLPISANVAATVSLLLYNEAMDATDTTLNRLNSVVAAALMAIATERSIDTIFLKNEIAYIEETVNFIQGNPVGQLTPDNQIADLDIVKNRLDVVATLRSFKEAASLAIPAPTTKSTLVDTARLRSLVNASNSLQSILSATGLEMIKMSIGDTINVRDEYIPSNAGSKLINYGAEGQSLEFKTSAVIAPHTNWKNVDINQKWVILKTICAFLNSNGGDLIIGVNDAGYAVGIKSDISTLFKSGKILAPTEDAYMRYLHENIYDTAFESFDRKYSGLAISSQFIDMRLEDDLTTDGQPTGLKVVRISVKPFKFGVVRIAANGRPDYIKEAYIRNQNSSAPMEQEHINRLTEQRRSALSSQSVSTNII